MSGSNRERVQREIPAIPRGRNEREAEDTFGFWERRRLHRNPGKSRTSSESLMDPVRRTCLSICLPSVYLSFSSQTRSICKESEDDARGASEGRAGSRRKQRDFFLSWAGAFVLTEIRPRVDTAGPGVDGVWESEEENFSGEEEEEEEEDK